METHSVTSGHSQSQSMLETEVVKYNFLNFHIVKNHAAEICTVDVK